MKTKTKTVVIEFDDGETHRLHPVNFRKMAETFGSEFRASFADHCEVLRKADPSISAIRKEGDAATR